MLESKRNSETEECSNSVTGNGSFTSADANLLLWLRKVGLQLSVVQVSVTIATKWPLKTA